MENIEQIGQTHDIIILVNGPGELSSYVKPTIEELQKRSKRSRIIIVLTPCPYSTGKETEIARQIPGVAGVINERDFTSWMIWRKPPNITFSKKGIVVFMGGDILYGKMIAKRLGYPAIAYSESYAKWPKIYKEFLVPDRMTFEKFKRQGFPEDRIKIVGNLMADSIRSKMDKTAVFGKYALDKNKKLISFLPGSRQFQVQFTLSFFSKAAEEIGRLRSNCQFIFVISPYLIKDILLSQLKRSGLQMKGNRISFKGVEIILVFEDQFDVINASDLVITVPGTNTAEVAAIGTPMIVVFPDAGFHLIPLEGIYDLIGKLPLLGYIFKRIYVKLLVLKSRFVAIPNLKTRKEIVPELKGTVLPVTVAKRAVLLIDDETQMEKMRKELKNSLGLPGAGGRIAEEILNEALF